MYESNPYYIPDDFQPGNTTVNQNFMGNSNISGPSSLCEGQTGHYRVLPNFSGSILSDIKWKGSDNIIILTPAQQETVRSVY